ncbi:HD domain-containing protein [Metabacillus indicus]|uniref:HD domain-containing protein n=1 Tax=Metabacillus indicus TaxID=246786 RepID=UPI0004937D59|nr:HD domain-containing protein [Metabacillus indicus]KEZ52481.1 hypothetical protein AZ46_0201500 [Metabacillus indicus LMG 22858]
MLIKDSIYGEVIIDGVLEELIMSGPLQRLKGIHQGGAGYLVNEKWNVTRYDHSVGVMLLIRMLGGTLEEQIAGLLHDVSYTAFSHVADYVFENRDEDYHEIIFRSVVESSEIPSILEKYRFDYRDILLDDSQWQLLEQPAPDLCADRMDYTLRDMFEYGVISSDEINWFLDKVTLADGKIAVKDIQSAEWFVKTYYQEVIDFFMDPLNIYANDILSRALKAAKSKGFISRDDFLDEDEELMSQLRAVNDSEVKELISKLHDHVRVMENELEYDLHQKNKVRIIDPLTYDGADIRRASVLSEKVKTMTSEALKKALSGVYVKILSDKKERHAT